MDQDPKASDAQLAAQIVVDVVVRLFGAVYGVALVGVSV